jgi:hypothetical protein
MTDRKYPKYLKITVLSLILLLLFQQNTTYCLDTNSDKISTSTSDAIKQLELAKHEIYSGQMEKAKIRLDRLLAILNRNNKKEKRILKEVKQLLVKIQSADNSSDTGPPPVISSPNENVIEHINTNPKKKKKISPLLIILGIAVTAGGIYLLTKKEKEYTLTVEHSDGIDGSPSPGQHRFKKGTNVNYSFSRKPGYGNLQVRLDGESVGDSGSFTMNGNRSLSATAGKAGYITRVQLQLTVTFSGQNIRVEHEINVDNFNIFEERLRFTQHFNWNDQWNDFQTIQRTVNFDEELGTFTFRQEADSDYSTFYDHEYCRCGYTHYQLNVIGYQFDGGVDPGPPTLSEYSFYLSVSPLYTRPSQEWYRIESRDITIFAPVNTSSKRN